MDMKRVGLWLSQLEMVPWSEGAELVRELEGLGYGALWLPEAVGRDGFVACTLALDATERIVIGTSTAQISRRHPMTTNAAWHTISAAHPDRFVLGLGVSHQSFVEGFQQVSYGKPLTAMRDYLEGMDRAMYFGPKAEHPKRVLAALGPKMLALSAEKADGAQPYNVTPEHTKQARDAVGDDKLLIVEQKATLTTDVGDARETARKALAVYTSLPNYVNNWKRLGFTDDDVADGGSDRLLDGMVVHGDEAAIRTRVQAHLDAGADHVCVQVLPVGNQYGIAREEWRALAPALLG